MGSTEKPYSETDKPKVARKNSLIERLAQSDTIKENPQTQVTVSRPDRVQIKKRRDPSAMHQNSRLTESKNTNAKFDPPQQHVKKSLGIGSSKTRVKKEKVDKFSASLTDKLVEKLPPFGSALNSRSLLEKAEEPVGGVTAPIFKDISVKKDSPTRIPTQPSRHKDIEEIDLLALKEAGYITPDMPPNVMAEEFRIIKRSLVMSAFARGDKKIKNGNVMMVTSSNPSEGKSFCAINLALSIATEQDVTVLLVDADFSKPEILNRLGISGGRGLMDVVADKSHDLADCLVRTNIPNLVLLPAGRQHNLTTELLASDRMRDMVTEIADRYMDRIIIFDSPPVLASSAASVLALYMGQTIFVVEAERTTEPQIKESLDLLSGCERINFILNKTRFVGGNKKFATYYGYGGR